MKSITSGAGKIVGMVFALLVIAGCGSQPAARVDKVAVKLDSYVVTTDVSSVTAGPVTFTATNEDTIEHEVLVVKVADLGDATSMSKEDVDRYYQELLTNALDTSTSRLVEDKIESLGEVSEIGGGKSGEVTLDVVPGKYLLLCNIAGHYQAGMYTGFTVTP